MLSQEVKAAEDDKANLGKQNNKLLVSKNPQAKTQYLDQLRIELNSTKKEVIKLQEENKTLKRKEDQASKKVHSLSNNMVLRQFCNNICRLLEVAPINFDSEATLINKPG